MRIVIALGGNALLQRGQPMTADNQRANIRVAAECIAAVAPGNEIVVAHGNGPQVGLLALQSAAYHDLGHGVAPYPLDVLGAQTEAMIGYVIEQELGNLLPTEQPLATLLTMIEVDRDDPAFGHPTKPIGPVYDKETAETLAAASGWSIAPDGDKFRRVVASPKPLRIFEIRPIRSLLEQGTIVICAGGGGIPTMYDEHGKLHGVEAVIDKDLASALLAEQLDADLLVIATDVDGVYTGWGTPEQTRLGRTTPDEIIGMDLPAGSMGPKVAAACGFARNTGKEAVIGSLADITTIVGGTAGTRVRTSWADTVSA
ncbi:carbamate kinase [Mycobacterium antarcticum]|uniref:carbamate kinase n=1 Tax=unclassified Mycolicibacterium TaxID=2636767 RepID=UPI002394475E|nr:MULTISPECIES: carbamate kinase [unclassified Mycolicibacterium]BDX31844.1 carbamate kinase [Mycolicibacterium sp. TUM20985]GLP75142.1 carbamate kinase [Mycolicibacterium sp. TUM20983]